MDPLMMRKKIAHEAKTHPYGDLQLMDFDTFKTYAEMEAFVERVPQMISAMAKFARDFQEAIIRWAASDPFKDFREGIYRAAEQVRQYRLSHMQMVVWEHRERGLTTVTGVAR